MKNVFKLFGIIALVAVMGISFASCGDSGGGSEPEGSTPVTGIKLDKTVLALGDGGVTDALTAAVTPDDATNKTVSWSSSAPAVATVSSSGLVTGLKEGSATITARTASGGKTATCAVQVISSYAMENTDYLKNLPANTQSTPYYLKPKIFQFGGDNWWEFWCVANGIKSAPNTYFKLDLFSDNATTIPNGAFMDCNNLLSVTMPYSVTTLNDWVLAGCKNLTSVTLGSNVTSIGEGVFSGCSSLASITLPNKVASIGDWAFGECDSLTSVTFQGGIPSGAYHEAALPLGDLRAKFYESNPSNGTPGTYTRASGGETWTKQ